MKINPNARAVVCSIAGAIIGWMIWDYSLAITGHEEPWDAGSSYFSRSLLISGFLVALIYPRFFWLAPIGLCVGQIAFIETSYHSTGPIIFPSFIGVLVFGAVPAFGGALAVYFPWKIITAVRNKEK